MIKRILKERNCSVARTLGIVGDAWTFLVLREPFFRVNRFNDLQSSLMISRNTMASRCKNLVAYGLLERRKYQDDPELFEYRLTEKGLDFYPCILTLMAWGDRWLAGKSGPPLVLSHKNCEDRLTPIVVCSECGRKIHPSDVSYQDGPGAGYSERTEVRRRRSSSPEIYERGRDCSVARTLKILGDRWSFLVLREAFFGVKRFDEVQRNLGIARNILTDRLQNLVAKGIFERRAYRLRPQRFEYRLTEKGRDLYPSIITLMRWGDRWLAGDSGPPVNLHHKLCEKQFVPSVICSRCREEVNPRHVTYPI